MTLSHKLKKARLYSAPLSLDRSATTSICLCPCLILFVCQLKSRPLNPPPHHPHDPCCPHQWQTEWTTGKNGTSQPAGSPWPLTPPPLLFFFLTGKQHFSTPFDLVLSSALLCYLSLCLCHYTSTISQVSSLPVSSGCNLPYSFSK